MRPDLMRPDVTPSSGTRTVTATSLYFAKRKMLIQTVSIGLITSCCSGSGPVLVCWGRNENQTREQWKMSLMDHVIRDYTQNCQKLLFCGNISEVWGGYKYAVS